jgi:hypothetical protein
MKNIVNWKRESSDRCSTHGLILTKLAFFTDLFGRALVFREVALGKKNYPDPLANENSEVNEENIEEPTIKLEPTREIFQKPSLVPHPQAVPKKRELRFQARPLQDSPHPIDVNMVNTSSNVDPEREKVVTSAESLLFNIPENNLNLEDYIYEELPPPYQLPPLKKLKTAQATISDKNLPFDNPPATVIREISVSENPFSQALEKINTSNTLTGNAFETSISTSILSILEDDTETW